MAMKEHPFMVTRTIQGDGSTIKYDITKKNRSDAVGKAFKINADSKGELVADGDEIEGKVIDVEDDHKFTAAYMFGGLRFPLGDAQTVSKGDRIVGALGAASAKGHVKAASTVAANTDLAAVSGAPTEAEHNAVRTAINDIYDDLVTLGASGNGKVLESDTSEALVAFGV
jgi:hypothetical protein